MRNKALLIAATAAVAVGAPASALGGDAHIAAGHAVVLKNESFKPATLRIHRGDSVTWKWQDGVFDRLLRRDESAESKWIYMRENPVRAGLVRRWEDWPYAIGYHV